MTLVTVPEAAFADFRRGWAQRLNVSLERLDEVWFGAEAHRRRETGPIRASILELSRALGVDADVEEIVTRRLDLMRKALVPDDGVAETLAELRRRGVRTGLISNCTEDVALVWDESPFTGLFDVAVFSALAGVAKPARQIYELALAELPVAASETLFVGDGANDELDGARRAGMTPVLFDDPGAPRRPHADGWTGIRITAIPQVLDLVS